MVTPGCAGVAVRRGYFRDRCPEKEKVFCKRCKKKGHYDRACTGKQGKSSSRGSTYAERARFAFRGKGSRVRRSK